MIVFGTMTAHGPSHPRHHHLPPPPQQQQHIAPPLPPQAPPPPEQPKRRRGRPPKALMLPPVMPQQTPPQQAGPPTQQDAAAQPPPPSPGRMMTRAMARAAARQQLSPEEAVGLQRRVYKAVSQLTHPQLLHTGGPNGPVPVVDEFNLPISTSNSEDPKIAKRRNFLKNLPPTVRNLLLTGDPVFAFDPLVYATVLSVPRRQQPQVLQDEFDYLPQPQQQQWIPPVPLSPPPASPPAPASPPTPAAPARRRPEHVILPETPPPQFSGGYFLRSSPEASNPLPYLHEQLHESWKTLQKRTAQVSHDLLAVPPPGWKPPSTTASSKPPNALQRVATRIKKEVTQPPPPWFEQDAGTSKPKGRGGGGARPKSK